MKTIFFIRILNLILVAVYSFKAATISSDSNFNFFLTFIIIFFIGSLFLNAILLNGLKFIFNK